MLQKFRFADFVLIMIPGALCVWGAYSTGNSDQADVRSQFPVMFLLAFGLYAAAYIVTRIIVPYRVQHVTTIVLLIPAFVTLFAAGISLGAGYHIAAFVCAPIWGALFGVGGIRADGSDPEPTNLS